MASKKKRNKRYRGRDAATTQPQIVRVDAVKRSKFGQWWFERKRLAKPIIIAVIVILFVTWCLIELIKLVL